MSSTIKVKLRNSSGIPVVRFLGVHFDGSVFSHDVSDGELRHVSDVHNGSIALTAFRTSDQQAIDSLYYPVSDDMGFAAVLLHDADDPDEPYKLVGEPFVIETSSQKAQ
jgi:hypothetical protein